MSADLVKTWAMENLGTYSEHLHNDLEGMARAQSSVTRQMMGERKRKEKDSTSSSSSNRYCNSRY